jgi:hypothetical protein
MKGTKYGAHYVLDLLPGQSEVVELRLREAAPCRRALFAQSMVGHPLRLTLDESGAAQPQSRLGLEPEPSSVEEHRRTLCDASAPFGEAFDATFTARQVEMEEFFDTRFPRHMPAEHAVVARQAYAGLLWSKQVRPSRWCKLLLIRAAVLPLRRGKLARR